MVKRLALFLASVAVTTITNGRANAQQATIGGYGCGTGCAVSIRQLSPATRMGNGWSKVLVEETIRQFDHNGKPDGTKKSKFWEFAKCDGTVHGKGYKSDGSDASMRSIYNEEGRPITDNAGGQVYLKWKSLCEAAR